MSIYIQKWIKKFNHTRFKYNKRTYLVIYTTLPEGFLALYIKLKKYKETIILIDSKDRNNKKLFHRALKNNKLITLNIYK